MRQEVVREPEFPKSNRKQTQTRLLAQTVDLLSVNGNPDSLTTSKPHSECYPALIPRHTQVVTGRRYLMYQTKGVTEDAYPGSFIKSNTFPEPRGREFLAFLVSLVALL